MLADDGVGVLKFDHKMKMFGPRGGAASFRQRKHDD